MDGPDFGSPANGPRQPLGRVNLQGRKQPGVEREPRLWAVRKLRKFRRQTDCLAAPVATSLWAVRNSREFRRRHRAVEDADLVESPFPVVHGVRSATKEELLGAPTGQDR